MKKLYDESEVLNYANAAYVQGVEAAAKVCDDAAQKAAVCSESEKCAQALALSIRALVTTPEPNRSEATDGKP